MRRLLPVFGLFCLVSSGGVFAKEIPGQARLFFGVNNSRPSQVNQELQAQGLKEVSNLAQYGVEITFPVLSFLNLGLRYSKKNIVKDELTTSALTNYESEIKQDAYAAVARFALLKSSIVRLDAFGAYGGTNSSIKIKTATQDGEYSRKDTAGWVAAPFAAYGASVAVGYKWVYFVVEGGFESNSVTNLKATGTLNGNINKLDLSGSFVTVGLLLDGIPISK